MTYRLLFACDHLAVLPAPLYAYFVNPAGISKKAWIPKRLDAWEAFDQQLVFFREMGDQDLVRYRLRTYLENAVGYYDAAHSAPNARELAPKCRWMKKRIRALIRQCRAEQILEYYPDQMDGILSFLRSRLDEESDSREVKKAIDALLRRGHNYGTIREALRIISLDSDEFIQE